MLSIIIVVTIIVTTIACGKKAEQIETDTKDITYAATNFEVQGLVGKPDMCFFRNGKIYIQTTDTVSTATHLYTVNMDGSSLSEIKLDLPEDSYVRQFFVDTDEMILGMVYSADSGELVKFSNDGKELLRANIIQSLKLGDSPNITHIVVDKKGNIVVVSNQIAYLLDNNFKPNGMIDMDNMVITDLAMTIDGEIVCKTDDLSSGEASAQVTILDTEKKTWGKTYDLPVNGILAGDSVMDGFAQYDFYYKDNVGIYGYEIENKKSTKLVDYVASNMTTDETDGLICIEENQFLGMDNAFMGDSSSGLFLYYKVDSSTIENRTILTIGTFGERKDIKQAAVTFNKRHTDYRIEFKDYLEEDGDGITAMNTDILAGNNLDIIVLNFLPVNQYVASGALENLTPYYEKDADINPNDIIDSVLEAMKIDGNLYYIAPNFNINSMACRTKDIGNRYGWTFDEMKALLAEKGNDVSLFYDESSSSKSELLSQLLCNGFTDFVNRETGECSFTSQDFKDILELCNQRGLQKETEMSDTEIQEMVNNAPIQMRKGKVLLYSTDALNLEGIQQAEQIFGEDVTYIGYPNREKQGSYFTFTCPLGICSTSEQKEIAWEFLRTFMTKEYQGLTINGASTPTRQDCFDLQIKAKMATESYTDEFGQEITPLESFWTWGGAEMSRTPLSQQEVDTYVNLVNHITRTSCDDETILNIIIEEAGAYFTGRRDIDETADIIQNRCKTYVSEHH